MAKLGHDTTRHPSNNFCRRTIHIRCPSTIGPQDSRSRDAESMGIHTYYGIFDCDIRINGRSSTVIRKLDRAVLLSCLLLCVRGNHRRAIFAPAASRRYTVTRSIHGRYEDAVISRVRCNYRDHTDDRAFHVITPIPAPAKVDYPPRSSPGNK